MSDTDAASDLAARVMRAETMSICACSRPIFFVLILTARCYEARHCTHVDVNATSESWTWSFECTSLDLEGYNMGSEGARALAGTLRVNDVLTRLHLKVNSFGDEGARALAEALKVNNVLTDLNLSRNSVCDEGARALAEALKVNSALTNLNLSHNSVRVDGAMALAEAIKVNSALTFLNLYDNQIGAGADNAIKHELAVPPVERPRVFAESMAAAAAEKRELRA